MLETVRRSVYVYLTDARSKAVHAFDITKRYVNRACWEWKKQCVQCKQCAYSAYSVRTVRTVRTVQAAITARERRSLALSVSTW